MDRNYKVKWTGGNSFIGSSANGHSIVIDGDKKLGMTPMDLLLISAGSCACIDLVMILKKARQKVIDAWVEVGGMRREEMPRYFTEVELHFVVKGIEIKEHHVKRAIELAMEKYCSSSAQLAALADIRTSYEIIEADTP